MTKTPLVKFVTAVIKANALDEVLPYVTDSVVKGLVEAVIQAKSLDKVLRKINSSDDVSVHDMIYDVGYVRDVISGDWISVFEEGTIYVENEGYTRNWRELEYWDATDTYTRIKPQ